MEKHHLSINRETLVDKLVDIIERQILTGKLVPGIKLSEAGIAKEFNVSRSPAREALLRLEEINLVQKTHLGRTVTKFSMEEFREIYEIKNVIEAYATMLSAKNITEFDLKKIKSVLEGMNNYVRPLDYKKLILLNNEFHDNIVYCCKNQKLIELYSMRVKQVRWTSVNYRSRPKLSVEEHQEIYDALVERDGIKARKLMERHTMESMERIIFEMKSKKSFPP